jgi:hypothetical protein
MGFGRSQGGSLHQATGCQRPLAGKQQAGLPLMKSQRRWRTRKGFVVMKPVEIRSDADLRRSKYS